MLRENTEQLVEKGDWCFLPKDANIGIRYGDDWFTGIVILPITLDGSGKSWKWNGSKESPTLEPSILVHEQLDWNVGWHGFLQDGKLVDA